MKMLVPDPSNANLAIQNHQNEMATINRHQTISGSSSLVSVSASQYRETGETEWDAKVQGD